MKKVLLMVPSLTLGGMERAAINVANALAIRGYDVTLKTISPDCPLSSELNNNVKHQIVPLKKFNIVYKIKGIYKVINFVNWFKFSKPAKLYKYYVGEEFYDVEIAFFRGYCVKIISGSTNKKSVKIAWEHSDVRYCDGFAGGFLRLRDVINAYKKFDKVVCVSNEAQKGFEEKTKLRDILTTIYNVIPIDKIYSLSLEPQEIIKKEKYNIVAVGRLVYVKGFDRLLEACRRLNEDNLAFDLWVIGDGDQKEFLENYALINGLNNVHFLGSDKNPYKYMKQADLIVCSSRYEGYNIVIAEALILGVSVVSTICTGPTEILNNGEYGLIVENNTNGIYEGIKKIVTHKELQSYYKKKAKERVDFFNQDIIMDKIEDLFIK